MEKRSSSVGLQIKSIDVVAEEAKTFIQRRRSGEEKSLKVASNKINDAFMNGID